jgi:hypothetical protein
MSERGMVQDGTPFHDAGDVVQEVRLQEEADQPVANFLHPDSDVDFLSYLFLIK